MSDLSNRNGCLEQNPRPNSHLLLILFTTITMSRFNDPNVRPIFASRTTFDALAVDSGEESEELTTEPETPERFVSTVFPPNFAIY